MQPPDDDNDDDRDVLIQSLRAERDVRLRSLSPRIQVTDERMRSGISEVHASVRALQFMAGLMLLALVVVLAMVIVIEGRTHP